MRAVFSALASYFGPDGRPTAIGQQLLQRLGQAVAAESYTVASLPAPSAGLLALVTDESGGAVLAFADGAAWRRVTDRAVVS